MKLYTRYLLFILLLIISFVSSCSLLPAKKISISDMSLFAKKVYNHVVLDNENCDMIEISKTETFTNDFFFSKIEIYDSFYLEGTLNKALVPFFGEELVGNDVSYVFALLGFYDMHGQKALYEEEAMIIKCGDLIYSFVTPGGTEHANNKFASVESITFGSYVFLTANSVTKYYQKNELIYDFILKKKEYKFSLDIYERYAFDTSSSGKTTEFYIEQSSFRALESDVTLELLEQTYVEKIYDTATIVSINFDNTSIGVVADKLPSLRTISFKKALNANYTSYAKVLRVNDIIQFYYYKRTAQYIPTTIRCDFIIVIS